jgi:hypothetical protein
MMLLLSSRGAYKGSPIIQNHLMTPFSPVQPGHARSALRDGLRPGASAGAAYVWRSEPALPPDVGTPLRRQPRPCPCSRPTPACVGGQGRGRVLADSPGHFELAFARGRRRALPPARTRLASLWCCRLCVCDLGFANADIRFSGTTVMVRPVPVGLALCVAGTCRASPGRPLGRQQGCDLAWQIASVACHIIS